MHRFPPALPSLALVLLLAGKAFAQNAEPQPFASFAAASEQVLNDPHDLAFGPDGNLWIADKFGNRLVLMDPDTLEIIGTVGEGALPGVHDVSFGPDGTAYAAVTGLNGVVAYDLSGGTPRNEGLLGPFPRTEGALAHSSGRLYVMASGSGQIFALEGETLIAVASGLFGAHDVEEGPDGNVWVADNAARRIVEFDQDLAFLRELSGSPYGFRGPRYLAFDPAGRLVVADQDAHRVLLIDPGTEALLGVIGTGEPGMGPNLLDDPEGVVARGNAYFFSDSDNNRIVKYVVLMN